MAGLLRLARRPSSAIVSRESWCSSRNRRRSTSSRGAVTDVDPDVGLVGIQAVRAAAERLDGRITVEQVAFPQSGLLTSPGTAELLEKALKGGVETIGGIDPAGVDRDPVRHLDAGVNLACGHDGIRDLWGPYGSGDMLERAMQVAYRSTFRRDKDIELALEAATYGGARTLGLASYGLRLGAPADLVVVAARTAAEAVVTRPVRELVLKGGRVVTRNRQVV